MTAFYGGAPPADAGVMETRLAEDGPQGAGLYDALMADVGGEPAGFVMFSPVYEAAFLGCGAFLRDIFVTERHRRNGVGRMLMVHLARHCQQRGWLRVDWHADRLDLDARTFFDLLCPDSFRLNRLSYRIDRDGIDALAARVI